MHDYSSRADSKSVAPQVYIFFLFLISRYMSSKLLKKNSQVGPSSFCSRDNQSHRKDQKVSCAAQATEEENESASTSFWCDNTSKPHERCVRRGEESINIPSSSHESSLEGLCCMYYQFFPFLWPLTAGLRESHEAICRVPAF